MTKIILLFSILALGVVSSAFASDAKESIFDRVIRTGTIKCGYVVYPPQLMKDVNTGEISGVVHDVMEKVAADLGMKVEWTEEVGSATMFEGLKTHRYDMLCVTISVTAARAREAMFTTPLLYTPVNAYVRSDDTRFDKDIKVANDPAYKLVGIDGSRGLTLAMENFPKSTINSLPELTDFSQLLLEVQMGKADVALSEASQFYDFLEKNPGSLKNATPNKPITVVASSLAVDGNEVRFLAMLNSAIEVLHNNGYIDRVIDKYEPHKGSWYRVALPYRVHE